MKEKYLELMAKALSAYSDEHIREYFGRVKREGLTEHGFPRLTVNIGALICHGYRQDLIPLFIEMMDFCCEQIPKVKAANDFSVREIINCLFAVEESGVVSAEDTQRWRGYLATIEPTSCYTQFATDPSDDIRNWALFTGVSEYFRGRAGLCDNADFVDLQVESQLKFFDGNAMYMDHKGSDIYHPLVYDLVTRGLLAMLLNSGYRGKHYDTVDAILKKSALLSLDMQSPCGEIGFGGRSNQFIHNEAWLSIVFEYEAKRYAREGNMELAARFKAAIERAIGVIEYWLEKEPIRHIKNRFPTETKYGCEDYAYFDKYMITVASKLHAAYLICDDSIPTATDADTSSCVFETSEHFHKLFLKSSGYGLEFDLNADTGYDANGLGRVHKAGAATTVCLSCPCPYESKYPLDAKNPFPFAMCSAIEADGTYRLGSDCASKYEVKDSFADESSAGATLVWHFDGERSVTEKYLVNAQGVSVELCGDGRIAYAFPAFSFDGETSPDIAVGENTLSVSYEGSSCIYTTDGKIVDFEKTVGNRNGHYRVFLATAENSLSFKIEIK